jgi:protein required for attachment to host cells
MPAHTCVVLADAARARFLTADADLEGITEIEDLIHPASRARTREIVSDDKGRRRGGPGEPKSGTEGPDAHATEAQTFARKVGQRIGEVRGDYRRIIVAAPPQFLGMLRGELDKGTVVETINRDFTKLKPHEVPQALRRHL